MTWFIWSTCSSTCGNGIKQRVRQCKGPENCSGPRVERESCDDLVDIEEHPECNEIEK